MEWKLKHCRAATAPDAPLETFLVEWKPELEEKIAELRENLETFLVEWKRPETGQMVFPFHPP